MKPFRYLVGCVAVWLLTSPSCSPAHARDASVAVDSLTYSPGSFIPRGLLQPARYDSFAGRWYTSALAAFVETALPATLPRATDQAYRFLWLRSFDPPIVVRAARHDGVTFVITRIGAENADNDGELPRRDSAFLSSTAWDTLIGTLDKERFWTAAHSDTTGPGIDGAQWVIEGVRDGRYTIVDRWSPRDTGQAAFVRRIGLTLLRLGRITNQRIY